MWFTSSMWYRRYVLWKLFLNTSVEEYDYILFSRLFDTKITTIRSILNLDFDDDTIYFSMDTLIYGKKEILDLFFSSFRNKNIWTDFEWTNDFTNAFRDFDCCLAYNKPTFCSEAQVFHYIWRTFPKWKNIRWDYNALDSPSHQEALFYIILVEGRETYK